MRKLILDICNYNKEPVCNIFDNQTNISGQAADVYIRTERNGWKELSFELPSTYSTEDGEVENHRIDYLIADWWIRAEDDYETDWYIISEPKIVHNAASKNVRVTAGHISQILRNKNLGLEFSDEEGNNVGTALELLTAILEGTGWTPGNVAKFMEDDDFTKEKRRSLEAQTRTGAFKMITDMCELFDAVPYFRGDQKQVDILPMNPFSRYVEYQNSQLVVGRIIDLEDGVIPTYAKTCEVLEVHYDKNMNSISRTINTENMVTKLTAEGSIGDAEIEPCSISNAQHYEYIFETDAIAEGTEVKFTDSFGEIYYFTAVEDIPAGQLVWSTLDLLSQSYIWDGTNAHPVYKTPNERVHSELTADPDVVKNWFSYLMNLSYYQEIGLLTQEMLNAAASFQRNMPHYIEVSNEKSLEFSESLMRLSDVGEPMTGFLKLDISGFGAGPNGSLKLYINSSQENEGVIYRSDYAEPRRKYFSWFVAHKLKANGDSVDNQGSVVYIIRQRENQPPLWIKGYVRSIDEKKTTYRDIDGVVNERYDNFVYTADNDPPQFITLFIDASDFQRQFGTLEDTNVYLFCTNSMLGELGTKLAADEAVIETLDSSTKVVTERHPTAFVEHENFSSEHSKKIPKPKDLSPSYSFLYVYYQSSEAQLGDLYFYYPGLFNTTRWSNLFVGDDLPGTIPSPKGDPEIISGYIYFFELKTKCLYRAVSGQWVKMDSVEEVRIAQNVSKTLYYCRKRDMIYKGLYEKYVYDIQVGQSLPVGNYVIPTPYNFYYFFTTDKEINFVNQGQEDLTDIEYNENNGVYESSLITLTPNAWYEYSFTNEVEILYYDENNNQLEDVYVNKLGTFYMQDASTETPEVSIVIRREKLPEGDEYVRGIATCHIWVDTDNNVVYQEHAVRNIVEAQFKSYDNVTFPVPNLLTDLNYCTGNIDNNGVDKTSNSMQRSYNISLFGGVTYQYKLPRNSKLFIYDSNKVFICMLAGSGNVEEYTTPIHAGYAKIVYSQEVRPSSYFLRIKDYEHKIFADNKMYTVLQNTYGDGMLLGVNHLINKFIELSDETYLTYLPDLLSAQAAVKAGENALAITLGDIYKEGWWREDKYIEGDEYKLYGDALSNLKEISKPATSYDISFIDTYGANDDDEFYVDEATSKLAYTDIQISDAVHLIDPEINTNLWAYIDVLNKCYDQPWQTSISINTNISNIGQHSFTDVMSYIAEVSKRTKANQSIYERAVNINQDGSIIADQIKGDIQTATTGISGGSSNWYTDEKGNIVIESQDGTGAMMLTGAGFMVAAGKNADGDWVWRSAGTGEGFYADAITGGTISGALIQAGTITANAVASNFGQELDIASNNGLMLYATMDGVRPAGGLETIRPETTDSFVLIEGYKEAEEQGEDPRQAHIDIASGGSVNVFGSSVNIDSTGALNLNGGSVLIDAGATTTITGSSVNISADSNVSIAGSTVNISSDSTMNLSSDGTFRIMSGSRFLVDSPKFKIYEKPLRQPPGYNSWTTEEKRAWDNNVYNAYNNAATEDAKYNIVTPLTPEQKETIVYLDGTIKATTGEIGGWTIGPDSLYSGSGSYYVELNSGSSEDAFVAGNNFSVTKTGAVSASNIAITGGSITLKDASDNDIFTASSDGVSITLKDSLNKILFSADSTGVNMCNGLFTANNDAVAIDGSKGYFTVDATNFTLDAAGNIKIGPGSIPSGSSDTAYIGNWKINNSGQIWGQWATTVTLLDATGGISIGTSITPTKHNTSVWLSTQGISVGTDASNTGITTENGGGINTSQLYVRGNIQCNEDSGTPQIELNGGGVYCKSLYIPNGTNPLTTLDTNGAIYCQALYLPDGNGGWVQVQP